jgi:DNA replicative helicase MCM subunit Mcm2 (Cdc46/Mcm family)
MMIELGVPCSEIELTGEAMEAIGDFYAELRSRSEESALPVTVRTLETVIRLSTAAAKARLSKGAAHLDTDERLSQA